jgi:predicted lysophospholipase L1 biosynthesis ABC-type transport system permease subunit
MKNNSINPGDDLQAIREIMERSSKFLSLSGLSGIFAGACALLGAAVAWFFILDSGHIQYNEYIRSLGGEPTSGIRLYLALDALLVLIFAVLGAVYFSHRKAKKAGQQFWTNSTRRLIVHLTIPLAAGGIFALILAFRNNMELVAPAMLIFYGLALVNAGKFTFGEIHYLGLTEIALGILAGVFTNYGLLLWATGFGVMHIVYGMVMYYRHEA